MVEFHLGGTMKMWRDKYPRFDRQFAESLRTNCPHVKAVWYSVWPDREFFQQGGQLLLRSPYVSPDVDYLRRKRVYGAEAVNPGVCEFRPMMKFAAGEDFTPEEVAQRIPVCLIDRQTERVLYPGRSALGQPLEVQGVKFTVKGVIDDVPDDPEPWGGAYIPMSFARSLLGCEEADYLFAKTSDPYAARDEMAAQYEARYRVEVDRSKQFMLAGEAQAKARREALFNAALLVSLAAGALVVGGVGMANIMLISAVARTREVGVRRALGATRLRIAGSFLAESGVLSLAGGLVGLVIGAVLTEYCLPLLYLAWDQTALWPTTLSLHWSVVAVGFGVTVGTTAAVGPAIRAGLIRPVEALREE